MVGNELTYAVIGCAMKVHSTLGNGFTEVIYQRSLAIELEKAKIGFKREKPQKIYYDGIEVGSRKADFIVDAKLMLELKAMPYITDVHLSQARNYLTAYNLQLGLLLNFGAKSLQYKHVFNKNDSYKSPKTP